MERARIILACLEGKEIQQVARELRVSIPCVSKWRQRFSLWGLRGLRDQSRPGKPVRYDTAFRNRVLALLEETPPPGMSHWDGPAVAERLDASVHAVWRVLRREGIYLQRRRSWCVSTDKEFAPKAAEVVGLYLNPPLNAVVLSVDEKPSIQAIERASGYVETALAAPPSAWVTPLLQVCICPFSQIAAAPRVFPGGDAIPPAPAIRSHTPPRSASFCSRQRKRRKHPGIPGSRSCNPSPYRSASNASRAKYPLILEHARFSTEATFSGATPRSFSSTCTHSSFRASRPRESCPECLRYRIKSRGIAAIFSGPRRAIRKAQVQIVQARYVWIDAARLVDRAPADHNVGRCPDDKVFQ